MSAPLRVGVVGVAHVHAPSFVHGFLNHPEATVVGVWDHEGPRGVDFASARQMPFVPDLADLLDQVDAVVICSENMRHVGQIQAAVAAGKHVLCEKPVAPTAEHIAALAELNPRPGQVLMTAFPCPFSPAYKSLETKVRQGEIGQILAICATNQGTCPFGWFVNADESGGGAMVDHVVHVADLLRRLLGQDPVRVQAQTGSNLYGQSWDDTAMLTLDYANGVFATLDSSWSKPNGYSTWGNVRLNVVGEKGVIEVDLFRTGVQVYGSGEGARHRHFGSGSDLDGLMVAEFVRACLAGDTPAVTLADGLAASRVAVAGYQSVAQGGAPVALPA